MSNDQFAAFMTGGMVLLVACALAIAWILWRERDARIDIAKSALTGVGHEYRINVQRMLAELYMASRGELSGPSALLPISHPQLNGVNSTLVETNRKALATINDSYLELTSRKELMREAMVSREAMDQHISDAQEATIEALATLYLWEEHKGAAPQDARSTRSWHVRDWMKHHRFPNDAFPEKHLRDEVVERLRQFGMTLTPKPLTHTAHEYYSLQYDRYADPRSPFGRRQLDEDGNVVKRTPKLKRSARRASNGEDAAGHDTNGADMPIGDAPDQDDVRASRIARLKQIGRSNNAKEASGEDQSRFSFSGLFSKLRGRGDAPPPPGE